MFLSRVRESTLSIILVGSQTEGMADEGSDIDLIVVTSHEKEAREVRRISSDLNRAYSRPILDCKVYTEKEFQSERSGKENLFLWTALRNGSAISGRDITRTVKLLPEELSNKVWRHIQVVEDACDKLEARVEFTGCCFHIYDALATCYFINKHILHIFDSSTKKQDFIMSTLGERYVNARERYYWVARHVKTNASPKQLRISKSVDQSYRRSDYASMHKKGLNTLELLRDTFLRVRKSFENTS